MRENIDKIKTWAKEHEKDIYAGAMLVGGLMVGYGIGRRLSTKEIRYFVATGGLNMLEYIRTNGLEATEEMVKSCYKIVT